MSRRCDFCGKGPIFGNTVSHSHKKTRRRWEPNLKKMTVKTENGNQAVKVCMDCLKAGKVEKFFQNV